MLDKSLLKHSDALAFQFILVGGGVAIGPDSHRCQTKDEVDVVVVVGP